MTECLDSIFLFCQCLFTYIEIKKMYLFRMHVRAIKLCIHIRVCVLGCRNIITQNIFARDRFHKTLMRIFSPDRLSGKEHSVFTGVAIIHCRSKGTCVILLKCSIFVKTQYFHKKKFSKDFYK